MGYVITAFPVDGDFDIGLFVVAFLGCRREGKLDRLENDVFRDTFLR